jgi:hypothetical protein
MAIDVEASVRRHELLGLKGMPDGMHDGGFQHGNVAVFGTGLISGAGKFSISHIHTIQVGRTQDVTA